jgi:hypothetical protein
VSEISNVKIIFTGGTKEECEALTDAIMFVLLEHGLPVTGMDIGEG